MEKDNIDDSDKLSELFRKYKPEQYYRRNYDDSKRFRSFITLLFVSIFAILTSILICKGILPS